MVLMRRLVWGILSGVLVLWASAFVPDMRRVALQKKITDLERAGMQVRCVSDTPSQTRYALTVIDERNTTRYLLANWGEGLIDPHVRAQMAAWLREGRIGIVVDWARYLKLQPRSIRVTFGGNAATRAHPALDRWLQAGHLGAWLSLGEGDRLTQATLMPIDACFEEDNTTQCWSMHGYELNVTRSHPTRQYDMATVMTGGHLSVRQREANQTEASLTLEQITCRTDTKGRRQGEATCTVPRVIVRDGADRLTLEGITVDQDVHEDNTTLIHTTRSRIKHLELAYRNDEEEGNLSMPDLSGTLRTEIGETIAYRMSSASPSLRLESRQRDGTRWQITLSGLRHTLLVRDIDNILAHPVVQRPASAPLGSEANTTQPAPSYEEEVLARIVHHGMRVAIDPLEIGALRIEGGGVREVFGATHLRLHARLDPNTLDVRRPSAPVLMLGAAHLAGRWSLARKDFETLIAALPPKIKVLLKIFVRYERDQAIFDLRFDRGHLRINGKQVM